MNEAAKWSVRTNEGHLAKIAENSWQIRQSRDHVNQTNI
jgi:hypothetical protein